LINITTLTTQAQDDSNTLNSLPRRNRQKCISSPSSLLNPSATKLREQNNPLHITLFPSAPLNAPLRTPLQFSLLLSSTLDIFELRSKSNSSSSGGLSGDFGLLHAIDERLAAYGFETNTGVKFIVVVDMRGKLVGNEKGGGSLGLREGEMKLVSVDCAVFDRGKITKWERLMELVE
jgi:hypothetical protein